MAQSRPGSAATEVLPPTPPASATAAATVTRTASNAAAPSTPTLPPSAPAPPHSRRRRSSEEMNAVGPMVATSSTGTVIAPHRSISAQATPVRSASTISPFPPYPIDSEFLTKAFLDFDALIPLPPRSQLPRQNSTGGMRFSQQQPPPGNDIPHMASGTTASITIVDLNNHRVVCAHIGDSRILAFSSGSGMVAPPVVEEGHGKGKENGQSRRKSLLEQHATAAAAAAASTHKTGKHGRGGKQHRSPQREREATSASTAAAAAASAAASSSSAMARTAEPDTTSTNFSLMYASRDHHPDEIEERERLMKHDYANTFLQFQPPSNSRVCHIIQRISLNVVRGFGDAWFKLDPNVEQRDQMVCAVPEVWRALFPMAAPSILPTQSSIHALRRTSSEEVDVTKRRRSKDGSHARNHSQSGPRPPSPSTSRCSTPVLAHGQSMSIADHHHQFSIPPPGETLYLVIASDGIWNSEFPPSTPGVNIRHGRTGGTTVKSSTASSFRATMAQAVAKAQRAAQKRAKKNKRAADRMPESDDDDDEEKDEEDSDDDEDEWNVKIDSTSDESDSFSSSGSDDEMTNISPAVAELRVDMAVAQYFYNHSRPFIQRTLGEQIKPQPVKFSTTGPASTPGAAAPGGGLTSALFRTSGTGVARRGSLGGNPAAASRKSLAIGEAQSYSDIVSNCLDLMMAQPPLNKANLKSTDNMSCWFLTITPVGVAPPTSGMGRSSGGYHERKSTATGFSPVDDPFASPPSPYATTPGSPRVRSDNVRRSLPMSSLSTLSSPRTGARAPLPLSTPFSPSSLASLPSPSPSPAPRGVPLFGTYPSSLAPPSLVQQHSTPMPPKEVDLLAKTPVIASRSLSLPTAATAQEMDTSSSPSLSSASTNRSQPIVPADRVSSIPSTTMMSPPKLKKAADRNQLTITPIAERPNEDAMVDLSPIEPPLSPSLQHMAEKMEENGVAGGSRPSTPDGESSVDSISMEVDAASPMQDRGSKKRRRVSEEKRSEESSSLSPSRITKSPALPPAVSRAASVSDLLFSGQSISAQLSSPQRPMHSPSRSQAHTPTSTHATPTASAKRNKRPQHDNPAPNARSTTRNRSRSRTPARQSQAEQEEQEQQPTRSARTRRASVTDSKHSVTPRRSLRIRARTPSPVAVSRKFTAPAVEEKEANASVGRGRRGRHASLPVMSSQRTQRGDGGGGGRGRGRGRPRTREQAQPSGGASAINKTQQPTKSPAVTPKPVPVDAPAPVSLKSGGDASLLPSLIVTKSGQSQIINGQLPTPTPSVTVSDPLPTINERSPSRKRARTVRG